MLIIVVMVTISWGCYIDVLALHGATNSNTLSWEVRTPLIYFNYTGQELHGNPLDLIASIFTGSFIFSLTFNLH